MEKIEELETRIERLENVLGVFIIFFVFLFLLIFGSWLILDNRTDILFRLIEGVYN